MTVDLTMLVYSTILAWATLMTGSMTRTRAHTPSGMVLAFGNRANLPPASDLAGRADRAAKNMLENLLLFAALVLTAHAAGAADATTALGAQIFFFARVVYFLVYLIGLPYLRTLVWSVSIAGMGMILVALLF